VGDSGAAMVKASPATSRLMGWGFRVPDFVVTNDDLAAVVETSDEWIQQRTGIRERRYVADGEGSVPLAEHAVRDAVAMAGIDLSDIDLILCGSLSPDIDWPGNASLLHERLGMAPVAAFDLRNQCSGFVYGLAIADQYVRSGGARYVLVVGSEVHSSGLDFEGARGRDVTVLFGDGAGAAVVGPSDDPNRGLLGFNLHADGRQAERLAVMGPGCKQRPRIRPDQLPPESPYVFPVMQGRHVFKHAVEGMTASVQEVAAQAGVGVDDIRMLLPHQANLRINQTVAGMLGLEESRINNNIDRYGNTTAATIPILLTETVAQGRIAAGDLVCFVAFGAGFTWGAALYRW
jgi:3-oxoacyl-[acyl-carrier-protein] synthase-3